MEEAVGTVDTGLRVDMLLFKVRESWHEMTK